MAVLAGDLNADADKRAAREFAFSTSGRGLLSRRIKFYQGTCPYRAIFNPHRQNCVLEENWPFLRCKSPPRPEPPLSALNADGCDRLIEALRYFYFHWPPSDWPFPCFPKPAVVLIVIWTGRKTAVFHRPSSLITNHCDLDHIVAVYSLYYPADERRKTPLHSHPTTTCNPPVSPTVFSVAVYWWVFNCIKRNAHFPFTFGHCPFRVSSTHFTVQAPHLSRILS